MDKKKRPPELIPADAFRGRRKNFFKPSRDVPLFFQHPCHLSRHNLSSLNNNKKKIHIKTPPVSRASRVSNYCPALHHSGYFLPRRVEHLPPIILSIQYELTRPLRSSPLRLTAVFFPSLAVVAGLFARRNPPRVERPLQQHLSRCPPPREKWLVADHVPAAHNAAPFVLPARPRLPAVSSGEEMPQEAA